MSLMTAWGHSRLIEPSVSNLFRSARESGHAVALIHSAARCRKPKWLSESKEAANRGGPVIEISGNGFTAPARRD